MCAPLGASRWRTAHRPHSNTGHNRPFATTARRSKALKLAEKLDPGNIGLISKEHAASLEMVGEYGQASTHYQQVCGRLPYFWPVL